MAAGSTAEVAVWVPIATAFGGSVVTLAVAWLQSKSAGADRRQAAIEASAERAIAAEDRHEERRQQLLDEHRERQYATLVELQQRVSDFVRAVGAAHHSDEMAWKHAGEPSHFPVSLLPEEMSEQLTTTQRRVLVLSQRAADPEIREGVKNIVTQGIQATSEGLDATRAAMKQMANGFPALNELIGAALRAIPSD
jgi:hypothetical protein